MKTFELKYRSFNENAVKIQADSADEAERYWRLVQLNGNVDTTNMEVVSVDEVMVGRSETEERG